jgi:hypothetical protein
MSRLAVALAVVLGLAGCRPYHMYRGEHRPASQLSRITYWGHVKLMDIDGEDTGLSKEFLILPGEHSIWVAVYRASGLVDAGSCILRLTTEANEHYYIGGGKLQSGKWGAWALVLDEPVGDGAGSGPLTKLVTQCECEKWD